MTGLFQSQPQSSNLTPDPEKIDRAVLALLWLTSFRERKEFLWSAWKGHDWEALGRLHEAGWISDPRNKNKSVVLSAEGAARAKALFEEMFCEAGDREGKGEEAAGERLPPETEADVSARISASVTRKLSVIPQPLPRPVRQPFPPSGLRLWESIAEEGKDRILSNVWCGHCGEVTRIEDFTGIPDERNDLFLRGFCARCGHVVVRLLETGERNPPPPPPPGFRKKSNR